MYVRVTERGGSLMRVLPRPGGPPETLEQTWVEAHADESDEQTEHAGNAEICPYRAQHGSDDDGGDENHDERERRDRPDSGRRGRAPGASTAPAHPIAASGEREGPSYSRIVP